jgi:4-diphosphocytidyl-2-C-methyl-D-erythritol kinase
MLVHPEEHQLVIHSPAKLNLFLEILSKRADGFHEIETLMTTIGLYDSLSFREELSDEITLTIQGVSEVTHPNGNITDIDSLPVDQNNLILRAAQLLRNHTGTAFGVQIHLWKRIPIAAGLAGGSSNAAATLIGLNRLWNLGLSLDELFQLSLQLGSDIPFFLSCSKSAICRGRGEIIEPVQLASGLDVVIAQPFTGNSTADVYRNCKPSQKSRSVNSLIEKLRSGNPLQAMPYLFNALQKPAEELNPEVGEMSHLFSQLPFSGHMMSGSGSSYFGLCRNRGMALSVSQQIKMRHRGFVFATRIGV